MKVEQYKKANVISKLLIALGQKLKDFLKYSDDDKIEINGKKFRLEFISLGKNGTTYVNINLDNPLKLSDYDMKEYPELVELNEKLKEQMRLHVEIMYDEVKSAHDQLELIFKKI